MKSQILFILILSFASLCFGQTDGEKISITGMVVDSSNRPVAGAKITIDGIQTGKSTNHKGYYKVKISPSAEKIGIYTFPPAYIEEPIHGRTSVNFTLNKSISQQINQQGDTNGNEEVNTGYGTEKRENSTASVATIDRTRKKNVTYTTIYDMLRGEIPGVSVVGTAVIIRGANSMSLSSEALYVVNGSPVSSLEYISPGEVKSIEVLKGPAASIYGSRGANGVILITLKN